MLYAHAATSVLSKGDDLRNGTALTAAVRNAAFTGVAGSVVRLDSNGDRNESYEVMNYVHGVDNSMSSAAVGLYNSSTVQRYVPSERAIAWPGKTTVVPADYLAGWLRCFFPICTRLPIDGSSRKSSKT